MGSRGASSGIADNGMKYGTEFRSVLVHENIKFVKSNSGSAKTPMETMSKGRIYATVNDQDKVKAITFYDNKNKRFQQIDIEGNPHSINGVKVLPHVHRGYFHNENGDRLLNKAEQKLVDKILKIWQNRK